MSTFEYLNMPPPENVTINDGVQFVLTSSAIDMSDFHLNPFIAFTGAFPTKIIPKELLRKMLYPRVPRNEDGSAKYAPYGMRKIEALLVSEFGEENVVVVHPCDLERFVGPKTKVIGISSMEPAGIGFVSRTYTSIVGFGGEPLAADEFRELIQKPLLRKWGAKIILGGSGAWQIERAKLRELYKIDSVVMGEGENGVIELFRKASNGEKLPPLVVTESPEPENIPHIIHPSLFGVVEISRGCGRGCKFCSPTMRRFYSFPLNSILTEVKLNAKNGTRMITLATEDLFLYKSKGKFLPNREAVVELVESVAAVPGVEFIQPAHASFAPVVYDPRMVEEIAPVLSEKARWVNGGVRHNSVQIGIETGSVRLMKKYMKGKMYPYKPEEWHDIVVKGIDVLNKNGIYPLCTLISGLPGEKEEDTLATLELLDKLKHSKVFYVPLLFTSEEDCMLREAKHADLRGLTPLQWEFIATCWKYNVAGFATQFQKSMIMFGSLFAYMFYYRWKHGKKVLSPILKFSGWEKFVSAG